MKNYEHLDQAIQELEESYVWIKAMAEVAKTAETAGEDLREAAKQCEALHEQSRIIANNIKSLEDIERQFIEKAQNEFNSSRTNLVKATSKMIDTHIELRQKILNDLSGIRQSLSTYHQNQIDIIQEEMNKSKKTLENTRNTISDTIGKNSEQMSERLNATENKLEMLISVINQQKKAQIRQTIILGLLLATGFAVVSLLIVFQ